MNVQQLPTRASTARLQDALARIAQRAARLISNKAAQVCGSQALVGARTLDRARRDLDLFLLQHRLDPKIAKLGTHTLHAEGV